jgi:hypothetical protein
LAKQITDKKELLLEYARCSQDFCYVIESYFETFDKTREGYVPFELFDGQRKLVANYKKHRFNLVLKYRQAGISTVTAAYSAVLTAFASPDRPEKVLILANKQETAIEFQNKIINFIKQLPDWVNVSFDKSSQKHVRLSNGSEIKAVATSQDALRGYTPTVLLIDEAAFVEGGQELWTACLASIGTGGKAVLISTPNGLDPIYYASYEGAIKGDNSFCVTHLKWWQDPRFNKDLRLIKTKDIVDWIQKPNTEKHEDVIESVIDLHQDVIAKFIADGYKPHSTWYENMCRDMNFNKRMINQELECAFIGSGDNVIEGEIIRKQEQENVRAPEVKDKAWDSNLWIWKLPEKGHRYILALDVSRGDSEDATGMCIIDYDTFEQVLEYHGKVPPDVAALIVDQYGRMYDALSTFDITGGMGIASTQKLKELNYPKKLLHYDNDGNNNSMYYMPDENAIPGINFASKNRRSQIVAALEEAVARGGFKIRSERLIAELKKFVYKNGKPDHMKGSHDDLIMALGMCLFVANTSFKRLQESDNMTRAMLDSWKITTNNTKTDADYLLKDVTSSPNPDKSYYNSDEFTTNNNMLNTKEFGWLFGVTKPKPKLNN